MDFIMLIAFLASIFSPGHAVLANLNNEQIPILQYAYERAVDAGIDPIKFVKLINCESQIENDAKGDYRKETKKFISQGILQFQKATYDTYSKKYGLAGTWLSPYSQINLATMIISKEKNGIYNWLNCGKKIGWIK